MIVEYGHIEGLAGLPSENDTPLVVYANGVEAVPTTLELLEPISGRHPKVAEICRVVQVEQLSSCGAADVGREALGHPGRTVEKQVFREPVAESLYHVTLLS
jgi:hypothetical protein